MLQTTVYNQGNAVITGCYYNAKGNKIDVAYTGTGDTIESHSVGLMVSIGTIYRHFIGGFIM